MPDPLHDLAVNNEERGAGEDPSDESQAELRELHDDVDSRAARLSERHAARLQCRRGCSACCVDDLTVVEPEAERIRRNHADLLRNGSPHPKGACAFLDGEGGCRIYADRPYVCRTQGLPLRWFVESDESEAGVVEHRDICPLNDKGPPLEELADDDCWLLGPVEGKLSELGAGSQRVALRSLFRLR